MPGVIVLAPITGSVNLTEPITGSVGITGPVTGAFKVTEPVTVSNFPAFPSVQTITGSVKLTEPVTGSVGLTGPITGSVKLTEGVFVINLPAVQTVTGSLRLTEPITGSVGLTGPITGAVGLTAPITGAVKITEPVTVVISNPAAGTQAITGSVRITEPITGSVGLTGPITGSVSLTQPVTGSFEITEPVEIWTKGVHSVGNSTTTPLAAGASFTGSWEEVVSYGAITLSVYSDVNSKPGPDGLRFQWGSDGTNVDASTNTEVTGSSGRAFILGPRSRYFRVLYGNGGTDQTVFRLSTDYHQNAVSPLQRALHENLTEQNLAQTTRTVIAGKKPDGIFANVALTSEGKLQVDASQTTTLVGLVETDLLNSGSAEMAVNGSVTNVFFEFKPDAVNDVEVNQLVLTGEAGTIDFGNAKFLGLANLTNGCRIQVKANDTLYELGDLKVTRDFALFANGGFSVYISGQDLLAAVRSFPAGLILKKAGTFANPDFVRVQIRDNVTGTGITSFRGRVKGVKK